jgi:hypothetical protein
LAVVAMRAMNAGSQDVSLNSLPAIYLLGRVDSIAKDTRGKMRSHCVSTDRKEMAQIQADSMKLSASFEIEMASYEKYAASGEDRRLLRSAMQAKQELFQRWKRIEPVSTRGDKKAAMKAFLAEAMPEFQELQEQHRRAQYIRRTKPTARSRKPRLWRGEVSSKWKGWRDWRSSAEPGSPGCWCAG